jgi:hypothetical protein
MSVQFDSGSFSASGPNPTKLTEFVLDRTVNVIIRLQVDQNDGGFFLGLVVRIPNGGPETVKTSQVVTDTGTVEIRFDAVPVGIYSIVIQSGDGTVSGTYRARWENLSDADAGDDGATLSVPSDEQFGEFAPIPDDAGVPVVAVVPVDSDQQADV